MKKELKLYIMGFVCLLIGISFSVFIDILFLAGIGLVTLAFITFIYANHSGSVELRKEIRKIDRESNIRLMMEILKIQKGGR